jgi:hypothetical protein
MMAPCVLPLPARRRPDPRPYGETKVEVTPPSDTGSMPNSPNRTAPSPPEPLNSPPRDQIAAGPKSMLIYCGAICYSHGNFLDFPVVSLRACVVPCATLRRGMRAVDKSPPGIRILGLWRRPLRLENAVPFRMGVDSSCGELPACVTMFVFAMRYMTGCL